MPNVRKRPTSQASNGEWPLKWVVVALMALIAALCWGLAAAEYPQRERAWRESPRDNSSDTDPFGTGNALDEFLSNAVGTIPHAGAVLGYTVQNSLWVVILFVVLEALALLFCLWARAFEKGLAEEARKRGA